MAALEGSLGTDPESHLGTARVNLESEGAINTHEVRSVYVAQYPGFLSRFCLTGLKKIWDCQTKSVTESLHGYSMHDKLPTDVLCRSVISLLKFDSVVQLAHTPMKKSLHSRSVSPCRLSETLQAGSMQLRECATILLLVAPASVPPVTCMYRMPKQYKEPGAPLELCMSTKVAQLVLLELTPIQSWDWRHIGVVATILENTVDQTTVAVMLAELITCSV